MHGKGGTCMAERGYVWQGVMHGRGACMAGGVHGGVGVHGGGHVWQGCMHGRGVCMAGGMHGSGACVTGGCAWQILQNTVNEQVVHILLECILVEHNFSFNFQTTKFFQLKKSNQIFNKSGFYMRLVNSRKLR